MGMLIPVQEFEGTIRPLTRRDLRWWKRSTYHRIAQINACLGELSSRSKPVTRRQLIRLLKAGFTVIFIAECANGFVAGTSTFVEPPTPFTTSWAGESATTPPSCAGARTRTIGYSTPKISASCGSPVKQPPNSDGSAISAPCRLAIFSETAGRRFL
jgi:hypothetical protein